MITLRRSAEREHVQRRQRDVWLTLYPKNGVDALAELAGEFEGLIAMSEGSLPPGAGVPLLPFREAEVITYVFEGALARGGATDGSSVTYAGEFQRRTAVRGIRHREANASRSDWARIFQISLSSPPGGLRLGLETKRFSIAQRRGVLCVVASPNGREGSLHLQSSAHVYSAILDSGRHLAYELAPRSSVWLHIVTGEVQMGDVVLTTGDGAGITAEHAVSLIARDDSEILLVGLAGPRPSSSSTGFAP